MTYAEWIKKQASFTDDSTGLRIDVRPVDKSDRIRQMIEGANRPYDLSKWLPACELDKTAAAFNWSAVGDWAKENLNPTAVGNWVKSNPGSAGLGLIGLLLGAGIGRKLVKPKYSGLGLMLGGALGAKYGGLGGQWLQDNGWIDAGINAWNNKIKPKMNKLIGRENATPGAAPGVPATR